MRPVVSGMPSPELFEADKAGVIDVHLAGCVMPAPQYLCSSCDQALDLDEHGSLVPFRPWDLGEG